MAVTSCRMYDRLSRLAAKLSSSAAARGPASTGEDVRHLRRREDLARKASITRARAAAAKLRRTPRPDGSS
jgi:hypothetical protein